MPDRQPSSTPSLIEQIIRQALIKTVALYANEEESDGFGASWIKALRDSFEIYYPVTQYYCFSKYKKSCFENENGKIEEFLYDLSVIESGMTTIAPGRRKNDKDLPVLGRPHWQIESEISSNTRLVLHDLGKLIQGGALNKLLITVERVSKERFLNFLSLASRDCSGRLFIAFIKPYNRNGPCQQGRGIQLRGLWEFESGIWMQHLDCFPPWPTSVESRPVE